MIEFLAFVVSAAISVMGYGFYVLCRLPMNRKPHEMDHG